MTTNDSDDVDQRLDDLEQEVTQLLEQCRMRSMARVVREYRRLAREERRLAAYLNAVTYLMVASYSLLDPKTGRDAAVELITLLESEDRARLFQPDLSMNEYEHKKHWLTSCAYDHLAHLTAISSGYNSDGMHACVEEGIQVCHRTGKLQCIHCFREYGTEIYRAADDLEMALHYARIGVVHENPGPQHRRYGSAEDCVRIHLVQGEFVKAEEALKVAWEFTDGSHNPYSSKLRCYNVASQLFHLAGTPEKLDAFPRRTTFEQSQQLAPSDIDMLIEPPRGEDPRYDWQRDFSLAVVESCRGNLDTAAGLLRDWDARLLEEPCLADWFENRLALVANALLTGRTSKAEDLAQPLHEAANKARDWLTLRRLNRLFDETSKPSPFPLVAPATSGPFAERTESSTSAAGLVANEVPQAPAPNVDASDDGAEAETSPHAARLTDLEQRLFTLEDPEARQELAREIRTLAADLVTHAEDAGRAMHIMRFAASEVVDVIETWNWAKSLLALFPDDPKIMSVFASLGDHLRRLADRQTPEDEGGDADVSAEIESAIPQDYLDRLVMESLDLDPNSAGNFCRAGMYYAAKDDMAEAERCFARSFRLDRTFAYAAERLADVYQSADRSRDALGVLDLAMREGCDDPDVAWRAMLIASQIEQHEAAVTYANRFDELRPNQPWLNHYRAFSLLELGRPDEALQVLDLEAEYNTDETYHVTLQRVSCLVALDRNEEFRREFEALMEIPLSQVAQLSSTGLMRLFQRLWLNIRQFQATDTSLVEFIESRMLQAGLAPNIYFDTIRESTPPSTDGSLTNAYECTVRQPLDETWPNAWGRLASEEDWTEYTTSWGVLARDAEEAEKIVLEWQARCFPLPAVIEDVQQSGENYSDPPGMIWQGYRFESPSNG